MQHRPVSSFHSLIHHLLFACCLLVFAAFFFWPIALTVKEGFIPSGGEGFTLRYIWGVMIDPVLRDSLINSFLVAVAVTALCMVLSLPLALLATQYRFPGKAIFASLILVPLILPPFVGAIGVRHLLGRFGAVNALLIELGLIDPANAIDFLGEGRFWGVVVMEALHLYPIIYLNVTASLANLDPAMDQAAQNLGASYLTRVRRIILPLILPGLFAGGTIVFIWAFTELGTPLMFDYYKVAPVQVFWGIQELESNPRPYALVIVTLVMSAGLYLVAKLLFGGRGHAMTTRAMTGESVKRLSFGKGLLAAIPFAVVIALAILPHLGVILAGVSQEGQWYRSVLPTGWTGDHFHGVLTHPLASRSINNSLKYASLATLLGLIFGFTISYLTVRVRIPGSKLLDSLAMLPLAVPGLVLAFGYVAMSQLWPIRPLAEYFAEREWTDAASLLQVTGKSPNPLLFLVVAYAIRRLPYVVRSVSSGLEQIAPELDEAAENLGASTMTRIRRVVMPLVIPNLIAGGLLAFSFAMLEVSDSLILAQIEDHYPMTKAIYALFQRLGDGPYIASAMGVWGMALLTVTLVGASAVLGKKLGAIFRV